MPEHDDSIELDAARWRIDELAQRSGTSVDTIRFYQREGLLPPARRGGRASTYGPLHLRSLELIRDLQARRFSLGAIKAITEGGRLDLVEAIFDTGDSRLDREQLVTESGLDAQLVTELESAGLVAPQGAPGTPESYDALDLRALQAVRGMLELGMTRRMVVLLAKTYVDHVRAMQEEVVSFFTSRGTAGPADISIASEAGGIRDLDQLMRLVEHLLENIHRRAAQRITFELVDPEGVEDGDGPAGTGAAGRRAR